MNQTPARTPPGVELPRRRSSSRQNWPALASFLVLAAMASALFRDPMHDSFPLSTYPMFAARPGPLQVVRVEATTDEQRLVVPAGGFGPDHSVLSGLLLERAVRPGSSGLEALCARVARYLLEQGREARTIEVVRLDFDAVPSLLEKRPARRRKVLGRCRARISRGKP